MIIDSAPVPLGVCQATVTDWKSGHSTDRVDWLAQEVPIAFVFNGISHAVMMATPADLEDFALGFGLSEGLLQSRAEFFSCEINETDNGIALNLEVSAACEWRLKAYRRSIAGRTGCGLCGTDSLLQVKRILPYSPEIYADAGTIASAMATLRHTQLRQKLTGATHAAAWCLSDGSAVLVREDVGRHCALDKLIGAMVRAELDPATGFICITSRASFEMVQKTAMAKVGLLAAISAPTAMAVDVAKSCNLALAGFVRGDDLVAYTFPERFGQSPT